MTDLEAQLIGKYIGIALAIGLPILWSVWRAKHPRTGPSLAYRLGRLFSGADDRGTK